MMMWGIIYLSDNLFPEELPRIHHQPMSVYTLIGGNLFAILCMLYPLEVLHPGWVNLRRLVRLMLPYLGITLLYFVVLALLGQSPRRLNSIPELLSSLWEFNVWYRFVLYITACIYIVALLVNTNIQTLDIRPRYTDDAPPLDNRSRLRLRIYGIGMIFITIAYLCVMLYGSLTCLIVHRAIAIAFFTTIACSVFFDRSDTKTTISDAAA